MRLVERRHNSAMAWLGLVVGSTARETRCDQKDFPQRSLQKEGVPESLCEELSNFDDSGRQYVPTVAVN